MSKKFRKTVVVVINKPEEKAFAFDKVLDEIATFAGPTALWAGVESQIEVASLAFFWFILCKAWAVQIRRNSK